MVSLVLLVLCADPAVGVDVRSAGAHALPASVELTAPPPAVDDENEADAEPEFKVPSRLTAPPLASARPLEPTADLLAIAARDAASGKLVVKGEPLTIEPLLQRKLSDTLRLYETPYSAVVVLDPASGRVLAMAEHSEVNPGLRGLCTKAVFPAASIFKLVTASALLEEGVAPDATECFHGGKRKLTEALLSDSEKDGACLPLSTALAMSANVIFAKLTKKHLSAEVLRLKAKAFRFNAPFAFPVPTEVSLAAIPEDDFGLSSAGAGFGDVYLSPLHGAALAAVAANKGLWRQPVLFEKDVVKEPGERVISEAHAAALTAMMQETTTTGTGRKIFRQRMYRSENAVGKTGSLADKRPFRDYSWFVGFAPKDDPKVAVAAVVVNDPYWRIRGTWLGAEAIRLALEALPKAPLATKSAP